MPSSDSMELRDRTVMILGGSGLVGLAVARRGLAAFPPRVGLVALFAEVGPAAAPAPQSHPDRAAVEQLTLVIELPRLIRHMQILAEGLRRAETKVYVKIGTSGTGGMGFNIPYTHSEQRPSRPLLMKSAVAGAHSLLLFLLGRTPGAPATIEIKPTATIAWREIRFGPVRRKGKPIPLVDCPEPIPVARAFGPDARAWRELGRPLEGVFIDVGENGLFARDEFEAFLCSRRRPTVRALAEAQAKGLAAEAHALVQGDGALRSHILSVGIPILAPDGERLYRGSLVVVPGEQPDPLGAAPRGWVDLRPEQFGIWIKRAKEMVTQAERRRLVAADSGSDYDWTGIGPDEAIAPSRFATWVFHYEDRGERVKRERPG